MKNLSSIWIPRGLLLLTCTAVFFLVLAKRGVPTLRVDPLTLHFAIILLGELFLLSWCLGRLLEREISLQRLDTYLFVFLLGNLFLLRPFMHAVLDNEFPDAPTIARIQPYLKPAYNLLAVVCGVFAVFAFRQINVFHKRTVAAVQIRRQDEIELEGRRRAGFAKNHPWLASTPLLGRLACFIAGEGWGVWVALFAFLVFGAALRLWNLDVLVPYADEYRHLNAAKLLFAGEPLSQLDYRRSLYTVTLPVLASFRALGISLWSARFAGVVVHLLAVIPLYLLARRIGKGVAILAAGLYMVDPWLVQSSRLVREYAYYPLLFFTILLVLIKLLEAIPDGVVWRRDFRSLITPKPLLYTAILLCVPFYIYRIDSLSTLRTISVIYPAFALVLLTKMDWRHRSNRMLGLLALGAAVLAVSVLALSAGSPGSLLTGKFTSYYFRLFYESPIQQIYYQRASVSFVVLLAAVIGTGFLVKGQKTGALLLLVYLLALLAFATFTLKDNRPRYGVSVQFWHVPVMAVGLYVAILILRRHFYQLLPWGLGAALLLLYYWNIPHSLTPGLYTQPGFAPISEDYHPDLSPSYEYLLAHSGPDDALVAPETFLLYLEWIDARKFDPTIEYLYDVKKPERIIYEAIENHPNGWVVLDYRTGYQWTRPLPFKDFEHAGKRVQFLGWFGDQYVFRWMD